MAVVKKLQPGGTIDSNLQDFLVGKIQENKFTKKGEKQARDAAERFLKLYSSGNFNEVYSFNPLQETYTIDTSKITDPELKGYE